MTLPSEPKRVRASSRRLALLLRFALAGALGIAAAVLIACGTTGKGLIPASSGGPLQSDIETVDQDAQEGNGNCAATEAALLKTDQDFAALPVSVDSGLRNNLRQGISNLRSVAAVAVHPAAGQDEYDHHARRRPPRQRPPTTTTTPPTRRRPPAPPSKKRPKRRKPKKRRVRAAARRLPGKARASRPAKAPAEPLPEEGENGQGGGK